MALPEASGVKVNRFGGLLSRKVTTDAWSISNKSLTQMEIVDTCAIVLHCTMYNVKTMSIL